jgi:hypothetical protein
VSTGLLAVLASLTAALGWASAPSRAADPAEQLRPSLGVAIPDGSDGLDIAALRDEAAVIWARFQDDQFVTRVNGHQKRERRRRAVAFEGGLKLGADQADQLRPPLGVAILDGSDSLDIAGLREEAAVIRARFQDDQFVTGISEHQIGVESDPFRLKLKAESRDTHSSGAELGKRERRRKAVAFDGGLKLGANAALEFEGNLVDSLRVTEDHPWTRIGKLLDWRQTRISQSEVRVGLADDRIRLGSSQALSQHDESDGDTTSENGLALRQTIEADVVRDGDWLVSTFLRRNLVDDAFYDAGVHRRREDPRGRNRHILSIGGTVGWGPFGLTLARETGERVRGGDGYQEENLRSILSVGLDDLWQRADLGPLPGLAPDAVWVSLARGEVDPGGTQASTRDRATEQGFGLTWGHNNTYADLSFWRYVYDGRQPNAEQADWIGHGAALAVGAYGADWNVDASLNFDRGDNQEPYSRSRDANFYGSFSVTHQPDNLPDLRLFLFLGSYKTDYLAYQGEILTHYGELGAEADFSKFLGAEGADDSPSLALLYWTRGESMNNTFAKDEKEGEHVVALVFKKTF